MIDKVNVYVMTYNSDASIRCCILSLKNQDYKNFDIHVLDFGSTDYTVEDVQDMKVDIIQYPRMPIGARRALATSMSHSEKVKYVAFLDSDCKAEPDWLTNLVNSFENREQRGRVGAVGGPLRALGDNFDMGVADLMKFPLGGGLSAQGVLTNYSGAPKQVKSLATANVLYDVERVLEVGNFCSTLSGCEDAELNSRLSQKYQLWLIPWASVDHYHHFNGVKGFIKWIKGYAESRSVAYMKFGRRMFSFTMLTGIALPIGIILMLGLFVQNQFIFWSLVVFYGYVMLMCAFFSGLDKSSFIATLLMPVLHFFWGFYTLTGILRGIESDDK